MTPRRLPQVVPYSRPARFAHGPRHPSATDSAVLAIQVAGLAGLVRGGGVMVLTGAGVSTDSGIPDYRGPDGNRATTQPMTYQEFADDPVARHRYWVRSYFGWGYIAAAQPNTCHAAVAAWERQGLVTGVVTQNVDGLHLAAGSREVVELHGNLARVICLDCREVTPRDAFTERMTAANAHRSWPAELGRIAPDGDRAVPEDVVSAFTVPGCARCGSDRLKPDVTYFGESVPADRVARAYDLLAASRALVVLGSSLTVMSGYRFVRDAARAQVPVAIVTQGASRGDAHATWRVDAPLGDVLPGLLAE